MVLGDRLQVVARLADGQELLLRQGRSPEDGDVTAVQPGDRAAIDFRPRSGLLIGGTAGDGGLETRDPTLEGAVT